MSRIAGAFVALLVIALGVWITTYSGCGYPEVKDPEQGAQQHESNAKCPQIPESGPYGEVSFEGIPLDKPMKPLIIKDKAGKILGRITTNLTYVKDGIVNIEYDFGTMERGSNRSHVFKLINAGEGQLKVVKDRSTCQCTVAGVKTDGLDKGQSTEIKLEWTAKGEARQFHQTAQLCTNDPKRKKIALHVKGMVARSIEMYPEGTWSLGILDDIKDATTEGWIASRSRDNMEILEFEYPKDAIKVEKTKMSKEDLAKYGGDASPYLTGFHLKITVLAKNEVGRFHHTVKVKTNVDGNAEFPIEVIGSRTGPIMIRPQPGLRYAPGAMRADLGRFEAKKGATATLNLYARGMGDKELKLESIKCEPEFLQVKLEPFKSKSGSTPATKGKSKQYLLKITIPPYPADRPLDAYQIGKVAKITMGTNHPQAKTLTVSLTFEPTD